MADHIFAFARTDDDGMAIVAVTRCPMALALEEGRPLVAPAAWNGTELVVPRNLQGKKAVAILDSAGSGPLPDRIPVGTLLARLPVALLEV